MAQWSVSGRRSEIFRTAWKLTDDGLQVTFPKQKPCEHAFVFEIELD